MFRTWKQADWRDKKAGRQTSMKGVGFLLGGKRDGGTVRDKDRVVQIEGRKTYLWTD